MYQPITPVMPFLPRFTSELVLRVLREPGEVLPVLEDRVDLAVGHRLEVRLALGDVRDLDLAAELASRART